MKKAVLSILVVSLLASLMGSCGKYEAGWETAKPVYSQSEKVWMETQNSVYLTGTKTVLVKWFNETDTDLTGGQAFTLEKLVGSTWRVLRKIGSEAAFDAVGYILPAGACFWQLYDLSLFTDALEPGDYRISAVLTDASSQGVQAYGEFKVDAQEQPREMTCCKDNYEYIDSYFGFVATLPSCWQGCVTVVTAGTGDAALDTLAATIDGDWMAVSIRPQSSVQGSVSQEITFACVSLDRWNSCEAVTGSGPNRLDALPKSVATRDWMLLFSSSSFGTGTSRIDASIAPIL